MIVFKSDIVSTVSAHPEGWLPCVLVVLLLLAISTANLVYVSAHAEKQFLKLSGER